jgi:hypothetical protein
MVTREAKEVLDRLPELLQEHLKIIVKERPFGEPFVEIKLVWRVEGSDDVTISTDCFNVGE